MSQGSPGILLSLWQRKGGESRVGAKLGEEGRGQEGPRALQRSHLVWRLNVTMFLVPSQKAEVAC